MQRLYFNTHTSAQLPYALTLKRPVRSQLALCRFFSLSARMPPSPRLTVSLTIVLGPPPPLT